MCPLNPQIEAGGDKILTMSRSAWDWCFHGNKKRGTASDLPEKNTPQIANSYSSESLAGKFENRKGQALHNFGESGEEKLKGLEQSSPMHSKN